MSTPISVCGYPERKRVGVLTPALTPMRKTPRKPKADARIRTGDPFITSEVLYQLSYVG